MQIDQENHPSPLSHPKNPPSDPLLFPPRFSPKQKKLSNPSVHLHSTMKNLLHPLPLEPNQKLQRGENATSRVVSTELRTKRLIRPASDIEGDPFFSFLLAPNDPPLSPAFLFSLFSGWCSPFLGWVVTCFVSEEGEREGQKRNASTREKRVGCSSLLLLLLSALPHVSKGTISMLKEICRPKKIEFWKQAEREAFRDELLERLADPETT